MSFDLNALDKLKKNLPSKKEEAWKYTSLAEFKNINWHFQTENESHLSHDQLHQLARHLPSDFYNIVFVDGCYNQTLSDDLGADFIVSQIADVDLIAEESHAEEKILKLANACLNHKIEINIPSQKIYDKPIQIMFVATQNSYFLSEKLEIKIGAAAQVILLLQSINLSSSHQNGLNVNADIKIEADANVKLIQVQNDNTKSYFFSQTEVELNSNVQFTSFVITLGAILARHYFHLQFVGKNADAGVFGLSALNDHQHADHYTFIQHKTGSNNSRQLYKSILAGSAQSVFRGRVRIEKNAQKANSEQLNNNLLLTKQAQANSIPQLEIYADDVKAGHGSTVGQLDPEQIFYFLSRGINQYEAVKMLSIGYAQELIFQFENKTIQTWLLKIIQNKLDSMVYHD